MSTGTSPVQESPDMWHEETYTFKRKLLKKSFGDIFGVKLGLKLSWNYGAAGIEDGKTTFLLYDSVEFEEVIADGPDLVVPSIGVYLQMDNGVWEMIPSQPCADGTVCTHPVISLELQKTSSRTAITFTVKNVGTADVTWLIKGGKVNTTKDGEPWNNGGSFELAYDSHLNPGEKETDTLYPGYGPGWEPGIYTLQVMVDHQDLVVELNEDNNLSPVISF